MEDNDIRPQDLAQEKYITFKTGEFLEMCGAAFMPPYYDSEKLRALLEDTLTCPESVRENTINTLVDKLTGTNEDCAPIAEHLLNTITSRRVDDAVVIRRQDSFAPPALDAYANLILAALEVDTKFTTEPNPRAQHLREIADYFHTEAAKSWQTDRKIPD